MVTSNLDSFKGLVIMGSSRSDGDTARAVSFLRSCVHLDLLDLNSFKISYYDYGHIYPNDEFLPLMRKVTSEYKLLVFATPVYWYTMSAIMKTFFDRITDCLKIEKDTGRKLRSMSMAVLSCSNDPAYPDSLYHPFEMSAEYLGMKYCGNVHVWVNNGLPSEVEFKIKGFAEQIKKELV